MMFENRSHNQQKQRMICHYIQISIHCWTAQPQQVLYSVECGFLHDSDLPHFNKTWGDNESTAYFPLGFCKPQWSIFSWQIDQVSYTRQINTYGLKVFTPTGEMLGKWLSILDREPVPIQRSAMLEYMLHYFGDNCLTSRPPVWIWVPKLSKLDWEPGYIYHCICRNNL